MAPTSVRRGQLLIAKFGSRAKKSAAIALLFDASEMPGIGWVQRGQNAWRNGALGASNPRAKRAHDEGLFMAVRSFEQPTSGSWLIDQVAMLVSPEDAVTSVGEFSLSTMWANPKFRGTHLDEREIEGPNFAGADAMRAFEWRTEGPDGPGFMDAVVVSVGSAWILVNFYRADNHWAWDEIVPFVELQVSKVMP
jgi:hypothetical protein